MPRNLDLTALRSFVATADAGGVTRAAHRLNLTQSAVSMQLKRLEEGLGLALLDRTGRGVVPTAQGEQLLGYARRMLELNDEALARLTNDDYQGILRFGVPHDIVYPHVPRVLQRFAAAYPRVRVQVTSLFTVRLKEMLSGGEMDLILTTEETVDRGGETLAVEPMVWVGAIGGQSWRRRPLQFASVAHCIFKRPAIDALEAAGMPWDMTVDAVSDLAVDATVSADLALSVRLAGAVPPDCEPVRHNGELPALPDYRICLYKTDGPQAALAELLAAFVRDAYAGAAMAAA